MRIRFALLVAFATLTTLSGAQFVDAAALNCSVINIVVPYGPGGGNDTSARAIATYLQKDIGTPVVVQNWPGAGGNIGRNKIYNTTPDGCLMATESNFGMAFGQVQGNVEYDVNKFSYIGSLGSDGRLILASNSSKFSDMKDVLANPAKVGVAGAGSGSHVTTLLVAGQLKTDWSYVFYDGTSDILAGLLRGEIDLAIVPTDAGVPLVEQGQVRPIAVIEPQRVERLPDVPTAAEVGYPDLVAAASTTSVVYAPPGVPDDALAVLREALARVLASDEFVNWSKGANIKFTYGDDKAAKNSVVNTLTFLDEYKDLFAKK
jgi:tripartite-type tricarboxylate transporter receptor subunit TctC